MEWFAIASSNLHEAAYSDDTHTLFVQFNNGSEYAYPNASKSLFNGLMNASSAGRYHAAFIKHLPYRRLH
ncbi:KTSC domain-containing protein [uncultured Weissella sp.]|uniref:KTSC domain-containing protein n=1 Tax=uncultured Weissella sp. TaxID=253243 RepID=UPI00344A40CA